MYYMNEGEFVMLSVIGFSVLAVLITLIALYVMYVRLITKRNKLREALSGIDVQLNKRYAVIPNILTIANKFMEHEKGLLTEIVNLRTQATKLTQTQEDIAKKLDLDNQISQKMRELMVNVENYPQLKSDQTMLMAMQTYTEVEEHIAAARRFYNSAANDINNDIEIFPSSLVAKMLNIKTYSFFEAPEEKKAEINASGYFK